MSADFSNIIRMLEKASKRGMEFFFDNEKLQVKVAKGVEIDPELLAEIRAYKDEIVDFLKSDINNKKDTEAPIVRRDRTPGEKIPLSYGQEGLWVVDQLTGSLQYHIKGVFRLKGRLDKAALNYALREIVGRHEALRTVISLSPEDGLPYQHLLDKENWQLQYTDECTEASLAEHLAAFSNTPFDLSADYMLRVQLIRMHEDENVLAIEIHHIAADGWSLSVLIKELSALYVAYVTQQPAVLPELPVQYSDYAVWQRQQVHSGELSKELAWWQLRLSGITALELPADYGRPPVKSTRGQLYVLPIPQDISTALKKYAQQEDVTLYMLMLTVFKVWLYRYSGQEDICVGSVIAGRTRWELESLIGFFVNTLALRSDLSGNPSFAALLAQVKETTLGAYQHQEVPFGKVVEAMEYERDLSRHPLFDVIFSLQNTPEVQLPRLGDVTLTAEKGAYVTSQFDLNVIVGETAQGLNVMVEYSTALYKEDTIRSMFDHYSTLLTAVLADPSRRIDELDMIGEAEREKVLYTFNDRAVTYPAGQSLVNVFAAQVARSANATAVVCGLESITYSTLDERSTRLARYLKRQGVTAESLVPVCMERSADMIVGILAILKAGGAYVPLDPRYPRDRITAMLSDTNYWVALTTTEYASLLNGREDAAVLRIDKLEHILEVLSPEPLPVDTNAASLAYVMYTSGSTGLPKGVLVTHGNITSLALGSDFVELSSADVLLSTGSVAFDASTIEYWGMLLNGGRLVLCPEDRLLDSVLLKEEIIQQGVTKMWFTSSWLNQLVDTDISVFAGLHTVIAGGEKLSPLHISKLRTAYPELELINGYGPTENTTFSLTYRIRETAFDNSIPIGRPLGNRTAYVLDARLNPVPIGIQGELYVGGAGLSRGYLNRPELTAERFIPHPFSNIPGDRLYKTGDIVKMLPDGNILYTGRADDQVKVRGYRIEPGEIATVLQQSGWVKQAVVILKEGKLLAYIVPEDGCDDSLLTTYLESRLPEYMIPAAFIQLDNLPLTNNGKIDRRALPDPGQTSAIAEKYTAPKTDAEIKLAAIWSELLKVEQVSAQDDFFKLGGDSIIAISVLSRIRKTFDKPVRLYDLYQYNVLSALAEMLETSAAAVQDEGPEIKIRADLETLKQQLLSSLPEIGRAHV